MSQTTSTEQIVTLTGDNWQRVAQAYRTVYTHVAGPLGYSPAGPGWVIEKWLAEAEGEHYLDGIREDAARQLHADMCGLLHQYGVWVEDTIRPTDYWGSLGQYVAVGTLSDHGAVEDHGFRQVSVVRLPTAGVR